MAEQHAYTESEQKAFNQGEQIGVMTVVGRTDRPIGIVPLYGPPELAAMNEGKVHGLAEGFATAVHIEDANNHAFGNLVQYYDRAVNNSPPNTDVGSVSEFKSVLPMLALIDLKDNFDHIHDSRIGSKMTLDEITTYAQQCKHSDLEQAALDFTVKNFKHLSEFIGAQDGITDADLRSGLNKIDNLETDMGVLSQDSPTAWSGLVQTEKEAGSFSTVQVGYKRLPNGMILRVHDPLFHENITHLDSQAESTLKYLDAHFDELADKGYSGISQFKISQKSDMICAKEAPSVMGDNRVLSTPASVSAEQKALEDANVHFRWFTQLDSYDGSRTAWKLWLGHTNEDGITRKDISKGLQTFAQIHDRIAELKKQLTDWSY
jgi:hypothetical protein